jgi:hypothetical protein
MSRFFDNKIVIHSGDVNDDDNGSNYHIDKQQRMGSILDALTRSENDAKMDSSDYSKRVMNLNGKKRKARDNDLVYYEGLSLDYKIKKYKSDLSNNHYDHIKEKLNIGKKTLQKLNPVIVNSFNKQSNEHGSVISKIFDALSTRGIIEESIIYDSENGSFNMNEEAEDIEAAHYQLVDFKSCKSTDKVSFLDIVDDMSRGKSCMICNLSFVDIQNLGVWRCSYLFRRYLDTSLYPTKFVLNNSPGIECKMDHISNHDVYDIYLKQSVYDLPLRRESYEEKLREIRTLPENILNWAVKPMLIKSIHFFNKNRIIDGM